PATVESSLSTTFTAAADARVEAANPSTNYGATTVLGVDTSPVKETYLRFKPSGLTGSVTRATLRLYVTNGTNNGPAVYRADDNWGEATITYANRPPTIGGALGNTASLAPGTWAEYDVTSAVTANGSYSFKLVPESSDTARFNSKEASGSK